MYQPKKRRLFGTSGIRGTLGTTLPPRLAYDMGLVFAEYLGNDGEVVVGHDVRFHSVVLYYQIIEGLRNGGIDVLAAGHLPTPALLHIQKSMGCAGAVMATGSHSLPFITGLLFFIKDGGETDEHIQDDLERIYFKRNFRRISTKGSVNQLESLSIYRDNMIQAAKRFRTGMKIVFDAGNGSMADTAPSLLNSVGNQVTAMNNVPDGNFPGRTPYPRKETLSGLRRKVIQSGAELGVATDGDGDRAVFVTRRGIVLQGDVVGAIFADRELAKKKMKIVAPLNSSNLLVHVCSKHGIEPILTRVGPPAIIGAVRRNPDTVFAFEETGKYIWPEVLLYGDSIYSTVRMIDILLRESTTLDELVSQYPKFYMLKRMVRCTEEEKWRAMSEVLNVCKKKFPEGRFVLVDGVKVQLEDDSWLLLRPSGTEPYFRCYAEAKSAKRAVQLASVGMKILKDSLHKVRS